MTNVPARRRSDQYRGDPHRGRGRFLIVYFMLSAVAVILFMSGCTVPTVYEVAVGTNVSKQMPWSKGQGGGFDGARDTFRFSVRKELPSRRVFVNYSHISHLSAGWPVNERGEDWLDVVEVGVRFGDHQ